ncbi:hypothetical protein MKZ08_07630 [Viridibacillus sp. FSL R5-0477]|nr:MULTISPECIES: hypothetical protein [Viridibacillus]
MVKLVGYYNLGMEMVILIGAFIGIAEILFPILEIGYVILQGYVNTKVVE